MLSKNVNKNILADGVGQNDVTYYCLSTDSKPAKAENGTVLVEMDTSTVYIFDEQNSTWRVL